MPTRRGDLHQRFIPHAGQMKYFRTGKEQWGALSPLPGIFWARCSNPITVAIQVFPPQEPSMTPNALRDNLWGPGRQAVPKTLALPTQT